MNNLLALTQGVGDFEQIQALMEFAKLGVSAITVVIAFGFVLVTLVNNRSSNKLTTSLAKSLGTSYERIDKLDKRLNEQEKQNKVYNETIMNTLNASVATLNQLVQQQSQLFNEVLGMRSDNVLVLELKEQLAALQLTTQEQARQLEEQALEITTLRESNVSLMSSLQQERVDKARLAAEAQQEKERKQQEIDALKNQFHALQAEFVEYKQSGKTNKEATLKNDLPQHPE